MQQIDPSLRYAWPLFLKLPQFGSHNSLNNNSIIVTQMEQHKASLPLMTKSNLRSSNIVSSQARRGGIRLEHEAIGSKHVFHDYGLGSDEAVIGFAAAELAGMMLSMQADNRETFQCAVVGAGVVGYFTALQLVKYGQRVTIYSDSFQELKKTPQPALVPRLFMPNHYDWAADSLRHELFAKVSYDYLKEAVRTSRYQAIRSIKAYDLVHSREDLREVVSEYVFDTFKETSLRFEGGQVQRATAYSTILADAPLFAEELRVEAVLRGVKLVERKIASRGEVLALRERFIFNCRGELFSDAEVERQDRVVLQFDAQSSQENEFVFSFGSNGAIFEVYSLRKKTYLVGPVSTLNLEEATEWAIRSWADFSKKHALLPSL